MSENTQSLPIQPQPVRPGEIQSKVASTLQHGSDPMDFIRRNLRQPAAATPPPAPAPAPAAPAAQPASSVEASFIDDALAALAETPPPPPPAKEDPAPEAEPPVDPAAEPVEEEPKKKGPEESLKDLRKKANELARLVEERNQELQAAKEQVEKYNTGEAIPEVLREKEDRIAELERYERLHALRLSKEYQQRYVAPITQAKQDALKLAQDYRVDPRVLDAALEIDNKKDLNQFLRRHFDDVGALEVRGVLENIKALDAEAQAAEAEPAQAIEQLRAEYQAREAELETQRIDTIVKTSRDAWIDGLKELRDTGKYPELSSSGDKEYDTKVLRPIMEQASKEYGQVMKFLGAAGTREVPPNIAKIIAQRFILSQITPVTAESRADHYKRAQEVIETAQRQAPLIRPQIGGMAGGVPAPPAPKPEPMTPKTASRLLVDRVLQRNS